MALAELAAEVAAEAGKLLMAQLPLGRWTDAIEHKAGRELVTRVDRDSERLIVRRIREARPDDAISAEEGGVVAGASANAAYRWIIDPLDGTTNFLHGHPMFAVSIGVERFAEDGRHTDGPDLVAAAVRLPYLGETYLAARGVGSFLNSLSIRLEVSSTEVLDDALVATGFAYDRQRHPNYDNFTALARAARGIRRCGAAAVDLAFVAAGRYDAFWELGLREHDVAAGALLVTEAGGRVTDLAGGADWLGGGRIVASNGRLHEAVRALLADGGPEAG